MYFCIPLARTPCIYPHTSELCEGWRTFSTRAQNGKPKNFLVYVYIYIYIHTYIHTHIYSSQYRDAGRANEIKIWEKRESRGPRKFFGLPFWAHVPKVRQPWYNSEVCHPRCAFKLYGEVNSVKKKHNSKIWLNDSVY